MNKVSECFWGAYCAHAVSTDRIGVYHCPFMGFCFKRLEVKVKKDEQGSR